MEDMKSCRHFLKTMKWDEWKNEETGQRLKTPPPPVQKPCPDGTRRINLIAPEKMSRKEMSLFEAIDRRKSHRKFLEDPLNLEELSFLLWATQGIKGISASGISTLRTVPSGGSRHPFETYLAIQRVEGIAPGLYRYLPLDHQVCEIFTGTKLMADISRACLDQKFVGESAVVFIWTTIPERAEWRYGIVSHKMIAMEAGHICQNLYLAATAIDSGMCAIGAYRNDEMDQVIGVDGENEFVIYLASLGKVSLLR